MDFKKPVTGCQESGVTGMYARVVQDMYEDRWWWTVEMTDEVRLKSDDTVIFSDSREEVETRVKGESYKTVVRLAKMVWRQ